MRLSIIIAVLNSHEIVRRQLLHYRKMNLPDDVEIIFIDDGSDPPLHFPEHGLKHFRIIPTNDKRAWTVELARNMGCRLSQGEYVLMTDIDYIIPESAIFDALKLKEDKMRFKRRFGILDENGNISQDLNELRKYGLLEERIKRKGTYMPPHPNNFVMKKSTFWKLGGYREDLVERSYPNKGDTYFKREWAKAYEKGEVTMCDYRPILLMFPNGQFCGDVDYNPFGLFHNLSRKSTRNPYYANMPH